MQHSCHLRVDSERSAVGEGARGGGEVGRGDERQEEMVGTGGERERRCVCENAWVRKVSENSRQKLEPNQTKTGGGEVRQR